MAMSTAMTMSTARIYRELLAMTGVGAAQEESDAPQKPVSKPAGRTPKARHIGALARASGQTVAEDVSEKDEREARDELARVEAEAKANADPRFKDEAPLPDPPGLMEDEPTVPPAPARGFAMKPAGGQWVVYEAETVQPDPGTSDTSSEGGCKTAPESTPVAIASIAGDSQSESSAGAEFPPSSSAPAPGPRDGGSLLRPSPALLSAVDGLLSKPPPVLAKRSAEGRAAPWTHAKLTKARKYFPCSVCQPDGVEIEVKAAIQFRAHYRDAGSGKRACLPCWERLESEAAGNTKGVA